EAERRGVANRTGAAAAPRRTVSLRCVFEQEELVPVGERPKRGEIDRLAVQVDGHDRGGLRRDRRFDGVRSYQRCLRVDVGDQRQSHASSGREAGRDATRHPERPWQCAGVSSGSAAAGPNAALTFPASRTTALDQPAPATRRWCGFTTREHVAAVAIFAAITFAFFFPLVRGDTYLDVAGRQHQFYPWAAAGGPSFPVLHVDQADSFYPWQVFMNRALRDGQFPLWNSYTFGGAPFFANGQSGVLYPPRLALTYVLSPTRVHDALLVT